MYQNSGSEQLEIEFSLPFGGHLKTENRWVILAEKIPWTDTDSQHPPKRTKGQNSFLKEDE